jgi:hypothetical protein
MEENLIQILSEHSSSNLGSGTQKTHISDLEVRLNILLPKDYKNYLVSLNYAELFGDPIFGINPEIKDIDLYTQNKDKEHFKYGFLYIFHSDIDSAIYLRPDTGAIYNGSFGNPVANDLFGFIKKVLSE